MCSARVASWHIRQGTCPAELRGLAGFLAPSVAHSRRICRILRSEYWNQVRFFKDCMWAACGVKGGNVGRQRRLFAEMSRNLNNVVEFLWQQVRPHLPKKTKVAPTAGRFTTLGDVVIPPDLGNTLGLGPKFCTQPSLRPPELLTLARRVAVRTDEEDRPRCISESLECLLGVRRPQVLHQKPLIDYLIDHQIVFWKRIKKIPL